MLGSFPAVAGGNIAPSRFVKLSSAAGTPSSTTEPVVLQSTAGSGNAGDPPWGISQPSTRRVPLAGWDDGYAAVSGEVFTVIGPGDDAALLEVAATVVPGSELKSDANGKGILYAASGDWIGAIALDAGVSGDLVRVKPVRYQRAS